MSDDLPLSRPVVVDTIPALGLNVTVDATPQECAALAANLGLPSIEHLKGSFKLTRRGSTVTAQGRVKAQLVQTCVVTLEPFAATLDEPVEMQFTDDPRKLAPAEDAGEREAQVDAPDPIVNGRIDLGSVTAEFFALGLDPYPRKPGAEFAWNEGEPEPSPFAKLAPLKTPPES